MTVAQPILILGTGGNCLDILDAIEQINACESEPVYECLGFLDDRPDTWGTRLEGLPVVGGLEKAKEFPQAILVNGIGSPESFWKKPEILTRTGAGPERFATIVHPSASIARTAVLGRGVVVLQNVVIASRAVIGDQVIVLANAVINHDDRVGDYTCIASGACLSGGVEVGRCCYLGANCSIRGGVVVEPGALVGMGSVVIGPVPANTVVAGNPARMLRSVR